MDKKRVLSYYIWFVIVAGAAVIAYCALHVPVARLDLRLAVLALLTIFFSARFAISIPNYSGHLTIFDTFIFLIILFYGREAAVFVASAEAVYTSFPYRQKPRAVAFNGAVLGISTFLSATAVRLLFGDVRELPRTDNLRVFLAAVCIMAIVQYVSNSGLAAIFTALRRDQGVGHTWSKYYLWSSITYLAGASAAGLVARLVQFDFYYILLATPIVFIIYLTYKTYLKNVETSAAQAEQAERERMREHYAQIEKLSALGELASGVAHNFNNTLTGILARAQLLLDVTDLREVGRGLGIIIQTAEDGAKTVKRIQDFARQRRDQDFVPIDVDQLMLEVAEITRPRWKDRAEAENVHIKLVRQIGSNAVIMGDAGELREVLVNMVFNAVDAMPQGGTLTLSTNEAGEEAEIRVSDTGTGMTEEVRAKVFDPFFTTKGKAGMGLGLSVSYGIIRRHEGTVEVESEVGRGTTFRVRFPKVGAAMLPAKAAAPQAQPMHGAGSLRILVVDDEDYVRELLADILEREGCEITLAAEGREALRLYDAGEFDAVFTDVGLPGMSGWELARAVRERDAEVALAVITGWGDEVSHEEQAAAQADWIIPKPFTVERITDLVNEVSNRRSSHNRLYAMRDAGD
ncbi:MAG TPA: ATP-binding protein [Pyrinomonadaceae bacterium]|jgi:signal transduction histidine kinase/CheY-like chemotaxis protein|nr:ATP-binding protein [Pyrinomonadaceae bacterium]